MVIQKEKNAHFGQTAYEIRYKNLCIKVTRPSFFGGYYPTLKLSGIPTFTFIVSLTHRMDNI